MNKETLERKVDEIVSNRQDYEMAHSREDDLHLEVIEEFAPDWVVAEIKRLSSADFPRHCA